MMSNKNDSNELSTHTRRDVVRAGAGMLTASAVLAMSGVASAQNRAAAAPATSPVGSPADAPALDPRTRYAQPPFPKQEQEAPGLTSKMDPRPDHGEQSYRGSGKLMGRKALITGGDSGIGRAAAIAFAREGADVAINYLPVEESDAVEVVALIRAAGRKAVAIPGDLRDEAFCKRLVTEAVQQLGGLDILVNNAGKQHAVEKLEDITTEQFDSTFKVNVYAPFWITREALKHLKPGASIINTASVVAYIALPFLVDYSQTKSCNISFTKTLAVQLAPRGIRVNAIAPGPIWTPLQPSGGMLQEKIPTFGADSPFGRPGQPAELASSFVLLASGDSTYTSGEVLSVTGGLAIS